MTLRAGSHLGPYEILAPLGAGGMGEVYRARDTRLGRDVAIKVLPAALSSAPERLKRFEREAQAASSLNHPNIVTIHDIGSADSVSYIAMELVNGESLRAVLVGGALPVRRLLQIGAQIAEGLAKAHAAGIVHRDLKPENVMVTEDGLVKILDFGLAKLTQPEGSGSGMTQGPTVSGGTEEGIILGTAGYMSPEQATGGTIDYRSDQFSFGSILYEMATGKRAFRRASSPQTLAAIIQEEPESIGTLNPKIPVPLRWVIERCLAKAARDRYASTEDLARDLATVRERISEATSSAGLVPEPTAPPKRRLGFPVGLLAGLLVAAAAFAVWRYSHRDDYWRNPLAGARFTRFTDWEGSELDGAISPDGQFVAFLSDRDGPFDAFVSQVGGGDSSNLTKGQIAELFFPVVRSVGFSGDGSHIWLRTVTEAGRKTSVVTVPTMGGAVQPFLPDAVSVAWSADRTRLAYHTSIAGDPIFVADYNGRNPRQIFIATKGTHNHFPVWSPNGRFVYFVQWVDPKNQDSDIWRIPSSGGVAARMTELHSRVTHPAFVGDDTLVYCALRPDGSGAGLWGLDTERKIPHLLTAGLEEYLSVSASADGRRLVATVANPVHSLWTIPISDRPVDQSGVTRLRLPSVRASAPRYGPDSILYVSSKGVAAGLWKWKDGSETELWKGSDGAVLFAPAVSSDGTRVAFAVQGGKQASLYVMSIDGTGARRLAESLDIADTPSWSPDGNWISFVATDGPSHPLFRVPANGGDPVRLIDGMNSNPVWSPDGRFIVYSEYEKAASNRLRAITLDSKPVALPEVRVRYQGNRYRFLPDGKHLVIMLGETWRPDFWLVDLETGRLRQLTNLGSAGLAIANFDVSPDGGKILFDGFRENSDIVLIDLPPR